jgi:hypothetical protein
MSYLSLSIPARKIYSLFFFILLSNKMTYVQNIDICTVICIKMEIFLSTNTSCTIFKFEQTFGYGQIIEQPSINSRAMLFYLVFFKFITTFVFDLTQHRQ